jgi:hypothetical protein
METEGNENLAFPSEDFLYIYFFGVALIVQMFTQAEGRGN